MKLYRANIDLSQEMYAVIGVFEIIFRNEIDRHMMVQKGPLWIENAVAPGGYLYANPRCSFSSHQVHDAMQRCGAKYTHDSLIAQLAFGFWRHQFSTSEYAASGNTLLKIFINRPHEIKLPEIFLRLRFINETRNRIAHHEPICFEHNHISTAKIERRYKTVLDLIKWLGYNPASMLYGIDSVPRSIDCINSIIFSASSSPAAVF